MTVHSRDLDALTYLLQWDIIYSLGWFSHCSGLLTVLVFDRDLVSTHGWQIKECLFDGTEFWYSSNNNYLQCDTISNTNALHGFPSFIFAMLTLKIGRATPEERPSAADKIDLISAATLLSRS